MLNAEDILVRFLSTPNPKAVKVVVNFQLKEGKPATFKKLEDCEELSLLANLFFIKELEQVYIVENQMTCTFSEELTRDFEQAIESCVRNFGPAHSPKFKTTEESKTKNQAEKPAHIKKIDEILDRTIRPSLQADGGDLEVKAFVKDVVYISYQGACGGCPSAYAGTLDAISNTLRYELKNDNLEVRPCED